MVNASNPMALVAEFFGTFLLMVSVLVSGGNALVVGATLTLIILAISHVSGGIVNPSLSLGMWFQGAITGMEMVKYMIVQLAGGLSASYLYSLIM